MSNTDSLSDLKFTKHEELLKKDASDIGFGTMAGDFGKAFVQSAAIDPVWNGLGQLVSAGNLPRVSIINESNAARSQGDAWAQKFGSAAGIAADFVLLSRGKKALFGAGPSTEALAAMPWQDRAMKNALDGAKLGAFYGAVLTPSDPKENLLLGRVANAGSQALTFGLLNFGSEAIGSAKMFKDLKPGTASFALKDMTASGLAGAPAGAIGAIADAKLHGRELKLANVGNAAVDYAVIGFVMSGMNHGIGTLNATDAHGVSTARKMTDAAGITTAPDLSKADFRVVDGKGEFDSFYRNRLDSAAPAETVVQVQQKQHGVLNGLFGDRFASYGDARPMLITHGNDLAVLPKLAQSPGLIATCEPLPAKFRMNDVFPTRSTSSDTSVWLQPKGDSKFSLSHAERPLVGDHTLEPVMLGLPRLAPVDATKIEPGHEQVVNPNLKLRRADDGKLFAESTGDTGIWTRINPGAEVKIDPKEQIYSSDRLIDSNLVESVTAEMPVETRKSLGDAGIFVTKKADGSLYITAPPGGLERIYIKAPVGMPVEISPVAKFIHLGPEGTLPITNKAFVVAKPKVEPAKEAPKTDDTTTGGAPTADKSAAPVELDPLVPTGPLTVIDPIAILKPAIPKPIVSTPVEDLGSLASRLTGKVIDPKDPSWRFGKFGDVVLDQAIGGIDAGDGTIRVIFGDGDLALSAGRFTTGIFKRRLQTDPADRDSAPRMRVTVDEFQDPAGNPLFVPVIDIAGFGKGRLVLGDNLRPLGVQSGSTLIKIDQTKP